MRMMCLELNLEKECCYYHLSGAGEKKEENYPKDKFL